jgi:hypothetical protein
VNIAPWLRIPESHVPVGWPGVPEVLLCPLELQVHCTVSPRWIVTDAGTKQKQLGPTMTVTVAALATVEEKARSGAIIHTNIAKRSDEVFMISNDLVTVTDIPACNCNHSVAARNTGKVTRLLPLQIVEAAAPFV